jgi:antitoxin component YwqK of YwqJK toxin-antitoxin module
MKMKLIFLFCFFIVLVFNAQSVSIINHINDTVNIVDENNMKQGYWIIKDKSNTFKQDEGNYTNNRKIGIWKGFYPSGKIKHEITFVNGRANGYAKFFYETGIISEEGIWKGNKWVGEYKYFHTNGKPYYEWKYNESGKRTGVQKYYHDNGQLMIEGEWNAGKEVGVIKEYYADGTIRSEKNFNDGKVDSLSVKFYEPLGTHTTNNNTNNNTEVKVVKDNTTNTENVGYFNADGQNTTYKRINGQRRKDQEGLFKSGKLQNGKKYSYNAQGVLTKTTIFNDGRIVRIVYRRNTKHLHTTYFVYLLVYGQIRYIFDNWRPQVIFNIVHAIQNKIFGSSYFIVKSNSFV